jgi:hypothetical protein
MDQVGGLRPRPASGPRERRLASLLGSLELAGCRVTWPEVRRSRETGTGPEAVVALRRAKTTVDPQAPLTVAAIRAWEP